MTMIWVTDPKGEVIETQFSTPWPEEAIRVGLENGRWKDQAIWQLSKNKQNMLVARVEYKGETCSVPLANLPKLIRMQILLGAY